jgi:hypothetical protein
MSEAAEFQKTLGTEVAQQLGQRYSFLKSRMELHAEVPDGHHVVTLSGSNKYSPFIEVAFYFGKRFAAARSIEKELGIYSFPCHVLQYSPNFAVRGLGSYRGPCTWSVDIRDPPQSLTSELVEAIRGLSDPFLERYGSMIAARDAIAANERDVFGGNMFWGQLLRLDLALNDLNHFERWASQLDDLAREQANEVIRKFVAVRRGA